MTKTQITHIVALLITLIGAGQVRAQHLIPSDTSIGDWDEETRTYTLATDVDWLLDTDVIVVNEDNMTLDGNGHSIFIKIPGRTGNGILLDNKTDVTVENITIVRATTINYCHVTGILVMDSTDNTFTNNSFESINKGIIVLSSNNTTIMNNTFLGNIWGVGVGWGSNNTVTGNTIESNNYGLGLLETDSISIYNNNFIENTSHIDPQPTPISTDDNVLFNLDKDVVPIVVGGLNGYSISHSLRYL